MNKRGFSLVELLAAIVILGLLSTIAIVGVNKIINTAESKHYNAQMQDMVMAAKSYSQDNRNVLPKRKGAITTVKLSQLQQAKYIGEITDRHKGVCDPETSYVQIFKYDDNHYSYTAFLSCPNYTSKSLDSEHDGPDITINFSGVSQNDPFSAAKANVVVTDPEKVVSYGYIISKKHVGGPASEQAYEVKNSGDIYGKAKKRITFDIPLGDYAPGIITVTVTGTDYNGNQRTLSKNVTIKNDNGPYCNPSDILESNNTWTEADVEGQNRCNAHKGLSCEKEIYTQLFTQTAEYGYITMKDTSGAIGECAIPIHIDKTAPVITGLTYNNKTLTGTATDDGSGIKYYLFSKTANLTNISSSGTVVNPTSTSITKTFSPTDTTATYYFYVQDQVGKIASRPITFTRITLEDHGDPSNESLDTDYVYTTKDVGVYLDQNHATQMTTGANPIVIPQVAGYRFTGYYSAASGGTQYIDSTGKITAAGITAGKGYSTAQTWHAQRSQCAAGTYSNLTNNTCTACPTGYPHSDAGATSINACYLTTTTAKYVARAGAGETGCVAGSYCPGGIRVYYNGIGGNTACPTAYPNSAAGASSINSCYLSTSAGKYVATAGAGQTNCNSGYYCTGGTTVYYNGTGGRTSCPSGYGASDASATANTKCYLNTTAGYYIGTARSSSQSQCTSGYYCPSTKVYYGSTGGRNSCPSGYGASPVRATANTSCYLTTTGGYYIGTARNSNQTQCQAGYYCPSATIYYGSTGNRQSCPSGKSSSAGASASSQCFSTGVRVTATFYYNKANWNGYSTTRSCTTSSNGTCTVTAPSISNLSGTNSWSPSGSFYASFSNLFSVKGWNTNSGASSATVSSGGTVTLSSNATYYAIVTLRTTWVRPFTEGSYGVFVRSGPSTGYGSTGLLPAGTGGGSWVGIDDWSYQGGSNPLWLHISSPSSCQCVGVNNCYTCVGWASATWLSW